jgi:hypothetical protein
MGHYVSVRGWIECDKSNFPAIEKIIDKYRISFQKYSISQETAELYQKGWQIPKDIINWTAYVFYGADIRQYNLDFIKDQIIEIGEIDVDIRAYFFIDDDENIKNYNWKLFEGVLSEFQRESIEQYLSNERK